MSISKSKRSRKRARQLSKAAGPAVVGPCVAAVRQACSPHQDNLAGLAPIFDFIGRHLDEALSQPISDGLLYGQGGRLVIVVRDKIWRNGMSTSMSEHDVHHLARQGAACLNELAVSAPMLADVTANTVSIQLWGQWSRHASESFRTGGIAWNGIASAALGVLLSAMPDALREMSSILAAGKTPVLAVALSTGGVKHSLRAVVFTMPSWARASGVVAGRA